MDIKIKLQYVNDLPYPQVDRKEVRLLFSIGGHVMDIKIKLQYVNDLPYPQVDRKEVRLLFSIGHHDGFSTGLCVFRGEVCFFDCLNDGSYSEDIYAPDDPEHENEPIASIEVNLPYWRRFAIHTLSPEDRQKLLHRSELWAELVGDTCTFGPPNEEGVQQKGLSYAPEGPALFYAREDVDLNPHFGDTPIAWFKA